MVLENTQAEQNRPNRAVTNTMNLLGILSRIPEIDELTRQALGRMAKNPQMVAVDPVAAVPTLVDKFGKDDIGRRLFQGRELQVPGSLENLPSDEPEAKRLVQSLVYAAAIVARPANRKEADKISANKSLVNQAQRIIDAARQQG